MSIAADILKAYEDQDLIHAAYCQAVLIDRDRFYSSTVYGF
jgi:hypothetical protein